MVRYSFILFLLSIHTPWATGYDGTTTFDSILLAHSSPTICPSPKDFDSYIPDASSIACCNHWFGPHTLTTGVGPGAQPVYACCMSGYTCTAPVSLMKDWSVDSNGDLQTRDLANAPAPTATPTATVTPPPSPRSTGTFSGPGATPLTTSAGVVVYVSNTNTNTNTNDTTNGGDSTPSAGVIAGITVACTVVMAIAAVIAVKYARRQANKKKEKFAAAAGKVMPAPVVDGQSYPYNNGNSRGVEGFSGGYMYGSGSGGYGMGQQQGRGGSGYYNN